MVDAIGGSTNLPQTGRLTTIAKNKTQSHSLFRIATTNITKTRTEQTARQAAAKPPDKQFILHDNDVVLRLKPEGEGQHTREVWVRLAKLKKLQRARTEMANRARVDTAQVVSHSSAPASASSTNSHATDKALNAIADRIGPVLGDVRGITPAYGNSVAEQFKGAIAPHLSSAKGDARRLTKLSIQLVNLAFSQLGLDPKLLSLKLSEGSGDAPDVRVKVSTAISKDHVSEVISLLKAAKEDPDKALPLFANSPYFEEFAPAEMHDLIGQRRAVLPNIRIPDMPDLKANSDVVLTHTIIDLMDNTTSPNKAMRLPMQKLACLERQLEPVRGQAELAKLREIVAADGVQAVEGAAENIVTIEQAWQTASRLDERSNTVRSNLKELGREKLKLERASKELASITALQAKIDTRESQTGLRLLPFITSRVEELGQIVRKGEQNVEALTESVSSEVFEILDEKKTLVSTLENTGGNIRNSADRLVNFLNTMTTQGMSNFTASDDYQLIMDEIAAQLPPAGAASSAQDVHKAMQEMLSSAYVLELADLGASGVEDVEQARTLLLDQFSTVNAETTKRPEGALDQVKTRLQDYASNTKAVFSGGTSEADKGGHASLSVAAMSDDPALWSSAFLQTVFQNVSGNFNDYNLFADSPEVVDGFKKLNQDMQDAIFQASDPFDDDFEEAPLANVSLKNRTAPFDGLVEKVVNSANAQFEVAAIKSEIQNYLVRENINYDIEEPQALAELVEIADALAAPVDHEPGLNTRKNLVRFIGVDKSREAAQSRKLDPTGTGVDTKLLLHRLRSDLEGASEEISSARKNIITVGGLARQLVDAEMSAEQPAAKPEEFRANIRELNELLSSRDEFLQGLVSDDFEGSVGDHIKTMVRAAILAERDQGITSKPLTVEGQTQSKASGVRAYPEMYQVEDIQAIFSRLQSWGFDTRMFAADILLGAAHVSAEVPAMPSNHPQQSPFALMPELRGLSHGDNGITMDDSWFSEIPTSSAREAHQAIQTWQNTPDAEGKSLNSFVATAPVNDRVRTTQVVWASDVAVQDKSTSAREKGRGVSATLPLNLATDKLSQRIFGPLSYKSNFNLNFESTSGMTGETKRGFGNYEFRLRNTSAMRGQIIADVALQVDGPDVSNWVSTGGADPRTGAGGRKSGLFSFDVGFTIRIGFDGSSGEGSSIGVKSTKELQEVIVRSLAGDLQITDMLGLVDSVEATQKTSNTFGIEADGSGKGGGIFGAGAGDVNASASYAYAQESVSYQSIDGNDDKSRVKHNTAFSAGRNHAATVPMGVGNIIAAGINDGVKDSGRNKAAEIVDSVVQTAPLGVLHGGGRRSTVGSGTVNRDKLTNEGGAPKKVETMKGIPYNPRITVRDNLIAVGGDKFAKVLDTDQAFSDGVMQAFKGAQNGDGIAIEMKLGKPGLEVIKDHQHELNMLEHAGKTGTAEYKKAKEKMDELLDPKTNPEMEPAAVFLVAGQGDEVKKSFQEIAFFSEVDVQSVGRRIVKGFVEVPN
ncbi:hypothetical protein [uncultured Tateyamaria sp.]|uniref:hypothetical protein n=1 Tax=uncultured Tateyamaria sp. TaxID=455651 RepID=UPI0026189DC7|nr:hypothetical protein [uncultured Tateyamaria sp.]